MLLGVVVVLAAASSSSSRAGGSLCDRSFLRARQVDHGASELLTLASLDDVPASTLLAPRALLQGISKMGRHLYSHGPRRAPPELLAVASKSVMVLRILSRP